MQLIIDHEIATNSQPYGERSTNVYMNIFYNIFYLLISISLLPVYFVGFELARVEV